MKIPWKLIIVIAVIVAAVYLGIQWRRRQPIEVGVDQVKTQDLVISVTAPGTIKARSEEIVFAPLTGTIKELNVSDQQLVEEKQVLAKYDIIPLLVVRDQAQAALETAELSRETVQRSSPLAAEKNAAQALIDQTKRARDEAQESYDNDASDANRAALDAAITAHEQAKAAMDVLHRRDPTQQVIDNAEAAVTSAEQALLQARINTGKATLKAPIAGRIFFSNTSTIAGSFEVQEDITIAAGQELFRIFSEQDGFTFEAEIDESEIAKVGFDQAAVVKLDAYPSWRLEGKVFYVSAESHQSATGENVFTVKIDLPDAPKNLRLGLSGDVEVVIETRPLQIVIPFEAVKFEKDKTIVFVVEDNQLKQVGVEVGDEVDGVYELISGLSDGRSVVVSDLDKLKDGQRVKIISDAAR